MSLGKELKRKRDAERRLDMRSPQSVLMTKDGEPVYIEPGEILDEVVKSLNDLKGKINLVEGDNISITIEDKNIKINHTGNADKILNKPVLVDSFEGKNDYILAYDEINGRFYLKKDEAGEGGEAWLSLLEKVLIKQPLFYHEISLTDIIIEEG